MLAHVASRDIQRSRARFSSAGSFSCQPPGHVLSKSPFLAVTGLSAPRRPLLCRGGLKCFTCSLHDGSWALTRKTWTAGPRNGSSKISPAGQKAANGLGIDFPCDFKPPNPSPHPARAELGFLGSAGLPAVTSKAVPTLDAARIRGRQRLGQVQVRAPISLSAWPKHTPHRPDTRREDPPALAAQSVQTLPASRALLLLYHLRMHYCALSPRCPVSPTQSPFRSPRLARSFVVLLSPSLRPSYIAPSRSTQAIHHTAKFCTRGQLSDCDNGEPKETLQAPNAPLRRLQKSASNSK